MLYNILRIDWFTPKQISVIYNDIIRHKIDFNFWDFKVKLFKK